MINSSAAQRLLLASVAYTAMIGGSSLHAQDANLPETVRTALARYADLKALAVTRSGSIEVTPLGREKIPAKMLDNLIAGGSRIQQLAFREGRIYLHREMKESSSAVSTTTEIAFDRNVIYMGRPERKQQPQQSKGKGRAAISKWVPEKDHLERNYFSDDYFRASGIRLPTCTKELIQEWHPQSELLALLAEGGRIAAFGPTKLGGRPLIRVQVAAKDPWLHGTPRDLSTMEKVLRLQRGITEEEVQRRLKVARKLQETRSPLRRYDFYLDPECAYVIRRLDTMDQAGHLLTRADCTEYELLPDRVIWMPRRCRLEKYTFSELRDKETLIPIVFGSPLYITQFQVSAFDVEPWPYDRFELKYTKPGTYVHDATFSEVKGKQGVTYTVPANPQLLDEVIAGARASYQSQMNATKWSSTISTVLLIVNGVGLSILVFYLIARWRKKASSA